MPRLLPERRVSCDRARPFRWDGVFDASSAGPAPQQAKTVGVGFARRYARATRTVCILNVFAPAQTAEPLPVFVWIFGGGFIHGDGADPLFDGSNLARAGRIVVVTINYRLGVWGFAPLYDRNVGLRDQVAALHWIQTQHRRIRRRSGQRHGRRRIGRRDERLQSARVSGRTGLFHRAIAQSGAADNVATRAASRRDRRRSPRELAVDPDDADAAALLAHNARSMSRLRRCTTRARYGRTSTVTCCR